MKSQRIRIFIFPFIICITVLSLIACAPHTRVAVSQLDTPGHHTYAGLKLLNLWKYSDAQREFKMAIQLDNNYSKAYTGLALVNIFTGKFDIASDNLTLGSKYATSDEDKLFINVSKIRYYTISKADSKWLELAANQYDEAIKMDPKCSPAYYYMGLAYKEGLQFNQAGEMFTKVVQLKTDHIADANTQLIFLQKVQMAKPATEVAKKIALVEFITRAHAAALFMEELKIKELYIKTEPKVAEAPSKEKEVEKVSTEMKATDKMPVGVPAPALESSSTPVKLLANDIANHPLKTDIEGILETGVRGLENDPKGNFNPGEIMSRGEFAIILEGVLVKITGEKDIAARYVNEKSLFPDVPGDMPYFKAIVAVTSQEIMEAKNIKTGEFAPLKPLSGVEALLTIRKLKDKLNIN